jgi:hypothetical protein
MRHGLLAISIVCIGVAGCSGDDDAARPASTTTTIAPPSTNSTVAPSAPSTSAPPAANVAEAEGWRLLVSSPEPGATIAPRTTLCYEVTGTSRESIVALRASLVGAATVPPPDLSIAVGRGAAFVDFGAVAPNVYDLRVQLVVDGAAHDELVVSIPVTIAAAATDPAC